MGGAETASKKSSLPLPGAASVGVEAFEESTTYEGGAVDEEKDGFRVDEKLVDLGEAEGGPPVRPEFVPGLTESELLGAVDDPDCEFERFPRNLSNVPPDPPLLDPDEELDSVIRLAERPSGVRYDVDVGEEESFGERWGEPLVERSSSRINSSS